MKLLPAAITLLIFTLIWSLDLTASVGAHPWWSGKVVLIGGGIGLVAGFFMARLRPVLGAILFLVIAISAFVAAGMGKEQFAASYAEDRLAGQIWYFGWIATMAGVAGFLLTGSEIVLRRLRPDQT